MSFPQDPRRRGGAGSGFSTTGRRTAMGYWLPLALTVGVATVSVAAWIWSERDEDDDNDNDEDRPHYEGDAHYPPPGVVGGDFPPGYDAGDFARGVGTDLPPGDTPYDPSFMGRMQGALRRTPSPQQIFDGASRKVVAGVTAAGAFVGGALTSIREENRGDFEDHTRWSEEAQSRANERSQQAAVGPTMSGAVSSRAPGQFEKKKKTVVIVVSSLSPADSDEFGSEHAVRITCNSFAFVYTDNRSRSCPTSPNTSTQRLLGFLF